MRGPRRSILLGAALAALAVSPAQAAPSLGAAELLGTTSLTAPAVRDGSCLQRRAASGAVRHERITAAANGLIRATLVAKGGDWDLAVFDGDRLVAGSAHFGSRELAEGVVAAGTGLVVQACRRSGSARVAQVRAINVPLPAPSGERIRLVRVGLPLPGSRDLLDSLDLDLTEHARPGVQDVLLFGDADERRLRESGLPFTTVVDDVYAADRAAIQRRYDAPPQPLPSGRVQYRRLAEYSEDLKALASENPDLVRPIVLPHPTLEGRPVEGVEISRDVGAADGKPIFLQLGVHHAREWPSAEMVMEYAIDLVDSYKAGDERITGLLEKARVIAIPLVNPDGFNLSRESLVDAGQPIVDPGFAYKRKNCRIVDGEVPAEGECGLQENRSFGTDPNRNYGQFWGGPGAASYNVDDTYRGAAPFSEPETQNVRHLVSTRHITTLITNHTYSDLILRPPGLAAQGDPPDEPIYKALGDAMAAENGYLSQKSFELYDTTGTTEDWSYFATGGLGFTFEIGKAHEDQTLVGVGFHPAFPLGVIAEYYGKYPTGGGNREAYLIALEHTADASKHSVLEGLAPAGATIRLTKSFTTFPSNEEAPPFEDVLRTETVVPDSGAFEYHVNPSTRPITIKEGGAPEAWKLECVRADGSIGGRRDVVVARGERLALGDVCAGAGADGTLGLSAKPKGKPSLRKGVKVAVRCSAACAVTARLVVPKRAARRAGLGSKAVTIARAKRTLDTGRGKLRLKVKGKARRLSSLGATLKVKAAAGGGARASRSQKLTLRR